MDENGQLSLEELLLQGAKEYEQEPSRELLKLEIKTAIDDALSETNVPTIVRFDRERMQEQYYKFDNDAQQRIHEDAIMLSRIYVLLEKAKLHTDDARLPDLKKQIMAELFVHSNFDITNQAWLECVDRLLPDVEGLDILNPKHLRNIIQARDTQRYLLFRKNAFHSTVISTIELLMKREGEQVDRLLYQKALQRCIGMRAMNEYQVEAAMNDTVRETGLSHDAVRSIARAFDHYYDIIDSNKPPDLL